MTSDWDLMAYDKHGQLALAVEVTQEIGVSPDWAAQWRHNILAHGTYPNPPYLLFAFPDQFLLWVSAPDHGELVPPTLVIPAEPLLKSYYEDANVTADNVSEDRLAFIMFSWLNNVIHAAPRELAASDRWLQDSGLYQAIAGGRLKHGAPA